MRVICFIKYVKKHDNRANDEYQGMRLQTTRETTHL